MASRLGKYWTRSVSENFLGHPFLGLFSSHTPFSGRRGRRIRMYLPLADLFLRIQPLHTPSICLGPIYPTPITFVLIFHVLSLSHLFWILTFTVRSLPNPFPPHHPFSLFLFHHHLSLFLIQLCHLCLCLNLYLHMLPLFCTLLLLISRLPLPNLPIFRL